MSFDWGEYLNVANYLHDNLSSEASYRSGVSRSYYCAFGKVKLFCLANGLLKTTESKTSKVHSLIPERLIDADDEQLFEIGKRYEALKLRRLNADYDPFTKCFNQSFLRDTISKTDELLKLVSDY